MALRPNKYTVGALRIGVLSRAEYVELKWQRGKPKEKGYYWIEAEYYGPISPYRAAKIRWYDGEDWDIDIVEDDFSIGEWLGPLPVPDLS